MLSRYGPEENQARLLSVTLRPISQRDGSCVYGRVPVTKPRGLFTPKANLFSARTVYKFFSKLVAFSELIRISVVSRSQI